MRPGARPPNAVRDLVDADRELALLRELIQAASKGPGVEPLAAAAARMITAATASDVCFVHVLDDSDRSLTLAGATPPFDAEVGKIRLPLGQGISGWVASHREPVVITPGQGVRSALYAVRVVARHGTSRRWCRCRWRPTPAGWSACSTCTPSSGASSPSATSNCCW